ncbi:MAG: type II secretion system F family protein [Coprococcus sp.]|nr:type II secretion system F family protein [Coprococcus sp.]
MKTDYRKYKMKKKEIIACITVCSVIVSLISILFYNSLFPCVFLYPCEIFFIKLHAGYLRQKRQRKLRLEFKEMIEALAANMSAGYSLETAFHYVYEEMSGIYKGESDIEKELLIIKKGIQLNNSIELLLEDFGLRSGVSDIKEFAEVIAVAKKTGGNIVKIIKKTSENIRRKQEVESEIATMVAAKKMEQRIMSMMPCCIVLYMRIANKGYMNTLYGNAAGIFIMTTCLLVMIGAICWGRRIVDIEV